MSALVYVAIQLNVDEPFFVIFSSRLVLPVQLVEGRRRMSYTPEYFLFLERGAARFLTFFSGENRYMFEVSNTTF